MKERATLFAMSSRTKIPSSCKISALLLFSLVLVLGALAVTLFRPVKQRGEVVLSTSDDSVSVETERESFQLSFSWPDTGALLVHASYEASKSGGFLNPDAPVQRASNTESFDLRWEQLDGDLLLSCDEPPDPLSMGSSQDQDLSSLAVAGLFHGCSIRVDRKGEMTVEGITEDMRVALTGLIGKLIPGIEMTLSGHLQRTEQNIDEIALEGFTVMLQSLWSDWVRDWIGHEASVTSHPLEPIRVEEELGALRIERETQCLGRLELEGVQCVRMRSARRKTGAFTISGENQRLLGMEATTQDLAFSNFEEKVVTAVLESESLIPRSVTIREERTLERGGSQQRKLEKQTVYRFSPKAKR